ncbi:hypothetical protein [Sphingomonas sp. BK069]|uniref:hypothetical protein n=1 Tax=Sphingomonas sp. BK069 TaxID=2586979 RepID=UPI001614F5C0|nr:hypothetical protein [Sphingomonas sp. BK069]MBB3349822.1 hypothetical protein [Sphingomonas sp. BK069]
MARGARGGPDGLVLESTELRRKERVAGEDDQPAQGFVDFWTLRRFAEHDLPASDFRLHGGRNERRREVSRLTGLPTMWFTNASRHAAVSEALRQERLQLRYTARRARLRDSRAAPSLRGHRRTPPPRWSTTVRRALAFRAISAPE